MQAYSKRSSAVIDWAQALGSATGRRLGVRLVKGAYWDSEIKRTQVEGLADYPLFTRKAATDVAYLACARQMLDSPNLFPAFATHNALTVATILDWAGPDRSSFEFQRLHGMGEGLYERLVREEGYACRSYAPVGGHRDLLAYLVRRLLENGANSSFVHQLADSAVDDATLLADPAGKIAAVGGSRHPSISLPRDLFPGRVNSAGLDLADAAVLAGVADEVRPQSSAVIRANARIHASTDRPPADPGIRQDDGVGVEAAVTAAHAAFPAWDATPVEARAAILDRLADLLERDRAKLMALCVRRGEEDDPRRARRSARGGRLRPLLCRAGARDLRSRDPAGADRRAHRAAAGGPRGVRVHCAVELTAGDLPRSGDGRARRPATASSPSPRRRRRASPPPRSRWRTRRACRSTCCNSSLGGAAAGEALVGDPRVMGVAFTGSTATARAIARTLLIDDRRPLVPLIAETGGLNAMIVDSTALPEQVVVDVVTSAFRSAGQRCSALRLLLLQEDVADHTLAMLKGAMDTLVVGDPADPRTDVGPVIDGGGVRPARNLPPVAARSLGARYRRSRDGQLRRSHHHPPRRDRRPAARVVRPHPPRRDVAGRRARRHRRGGQRQRLWPDDGPPQPDRDVGRPASRQAPGSATSTSIAR